MSDNNDELSRLPSPRQNENKYWVVSPNVKDDKNFREWGEKSIQNCAAYMGYEPHSRKHSQGPKFADTVDGGIEPGNVILIARRHQGEPEIVGFGIVRGKYETKRFLELSSDFVTQRKLSPFIICRKSPTNIPVIDALSHTRALARLYQTKAAHKSVCDWMERQFSKRGKNGKNEQENIERQNAVDDLSDAPEESQVPDRANFITRVIKRNNRVRAFAIKRAKGKCEHCKAQGFPMLNGGFYLEAHHIIALCDSGYDTVDNVIALCPQHHRQAHYGIDAESLEAEFIGILKNLNRK